MHYKPDTELNGFEMLQIEQPVDYEGKVVCTVVRKRSSKECRKAVLYIHGFNDYFFQEEMALRFINEGYNFYALDLRKYGRSLLPHQKFTNVRYLNEYYADIDAALNIIKDEGHDFVLLNGHSTGGLVGSLYAADHKKSKLFHSFFANSPFYDYNLGFFLKNIGVPIVSFLGGIFPNIRMKTDVNSLYGESLYKEDHGEWDYNPKLKMHNPPPVTFSFVRAIRNGHKRVQKGISINVPTLVMHSDNSVYGNKWKEDFMDGDAVLNVKHIRENAEKIKGDVKIIEVKHALHDLIMSRKDVRDEVYVRLFEWLQAL
ncbi:MAG: alpha/beta hydrolase [Bacteroidales bacterium]|nr:alpha/beta hydrolase [Bacteroidales bacterium]